MIPETVARNRGLHVGDVIVNKIIPQNMHCSFCGEKRKQQLKRIATIKEKFNDYRILEISLEKEEVKGMRMLEKIGRSLASGP